VRSIGSCCAVFMILFFMILCCVKTSQPAGRVMISQASSARTTASRPRAGGVPRRNGQALLAPGRRKLTCQVNLRRPGAVSGRDGQDTRISRWTGSGSKKFYWCSAASAFALRW
jgi:hypothetical protein